MNDLMQGGAEICPDEQEVRGFELSLRVHIPLLLELRDLGVVRRVETRLQCVGVQYPQLLEQNHPRCGIFFPLIREFAIRKGEYPIFLAEQIRNEPDNIVVLMLVDLPLP